MQQRFANANGKNASKRMGSKPVCAARTGYEFKCSVDTEQRQSFKLIKKNTTELIQELRAKEECKNVNFTCFCDLSEYEAWRGDEDQFHAQQQQQQRLKRMNTFDGIEQGGGGGAGGGEASTHIHPLLCILFGLLAMASFVGLMFVDVQNVLFLDNNRGQYCIVMRTICSRSLPNTSSMIPDQQGWEKLEIYLKFVQHCSGTVGFRAESKTSASPSSIFWAHRNNGFNDQQHHSMAQQQQRRRRRKSMKTFDGITQRGGGGGRGGGEAATSIHALCILFVLLAMAALVGLIVALGVPSLDHHAKLPIIIISVVVLVFNLALLCTMCSLPA
ncbi:hypothetical protein GPALN_013259 [Globodera pallida]|nr:hypothetical protein GPALN_013259 [Globodera pallida]